MPNSIYRLEVKDRHDGPRVLHLDLARLVAVSGPLFEDRMGSGGYFASVGLFYQLRGEPVRVRVGLPPGPARPEYRSNNEVTQAAFDEFKKAVADLVEAWTAYLKENPK